MKHRRGLAVGICLACLAHLPAAPAYAGWEDDFGTLRIGMVSPSGGRAIAGVTDMTTAFERATGIAVEILVARDYPSLVRAIAQGRLHYAAYSATAYAVTQELCGCVEPVAAPRGIDGAMGVRAVWIGRNGTQKALAALSDARLVSGPIANIGPEALALEALRDAGRSGGEGSIIHAGSYSEAERIFLSGDADVLAGWEPVYVEGDGEPQSGTLARLSSAGMKMSDLTIVWSSDLITYGPHVVRSDLPAQLKERLRRFLVNLQDQQPDIYEFLEPDRGGGFALATADDYSGALKVVAAIASR